MNNIHSFAIGQGYPYIRGNPKDIAYIVRKATGSDKPRALLANRFTKTPDGDGEALYVAWYAGRYWTHAECGK